MKDATDAEVASVALPVARLCRRFHALFIIDDRLHLVEPLGAEGIANVIETVRGAGSRVPVVAIGGIGVDDLAAVKATGATGVALSGVLLRAENKRLKTREILNTWKNS